MNFYLGREKGKIKKLSAVMFGWIRKRKKGRKEGNKRDMFLRDWYFNLEKQDLN